MKRTLKLTLVVSPEDEMLEQTVHDGDDEGCGEDIAVEKTADSIAKISKVLLGVLVTLGLDNNICTNTARTILVLIRLTWNSVSPL